MNRDTRARMNALLSKDPEKALANVPQAKTRRRINNSTTCTHHLFVRFFSFGRDSIILQDSERLLPRVVLVLEHVTEFELFRNSG